MHYDYDYDFDNDKKQDTKSVLKVLLANLYTGIKGELDPSMYTMNPTVGDTTFLPMTTIGEETAEPGGKGGQFPTLNL